MHAFLGDRFWADFVQQATAAHKADFLEAFHPAGQTMLCCEGPLAGGPCPRSFAVDLRSAEATRANASGLHLDHAFEVKQICILWRQTPQPKQRWDEHVDGELLCHLLFGVRDHARAADHPRLWRANLSFRCAPPKGNEKAAAQKKPRHEFCHVQDSAHYTHVLKLEDIARQGVGPALSSPASAGDSEDDPIWCV